MGSLKIEIDLPEFKEELTMSITIRKDGEVITSLSPDRGTTEIVKKETTTKKKSSSSSVKGGNLMGMEI